MNEKLELIIAIIGIVVASGLIKAIVQIKKEFKELIEVWKKDMEDGKIDSPEIIIKELNDVILQGFKIWEIIKKSIPKLKKKK